MAFIIGLGRLDLHHVFMLRRLNFYFRLRHTDDSVLRNILWSSVRLNCSDSILYCLSVLGRVKSTLFVGYMTVRL